MQPFKAWWPGADEADDAWVEKLLAPRGNPSTKAEDWAEALVGMEKPPSGSGLVSDGPTPRERLLAWERLWKERAVAIARARGVREIVNTTDSVRAVKS